MVGTHASALACTFLAAILRSLQCLATAEHASWSSRPRSWHHDSSSLQPSRSSPAASPGAGHVAACQGCGLLQAAPWLRQVAPWTDSSTRMRLGQCNSQLPADMVVSNGCAATGYCPATTAAVARIIRQHRGPCPVAWSPERQREVVSRLSSHSGLLQRVPASAGTYSQPIISPLAK